MVARSREPYVRVAESNLDAWDGSIERLAARADLLLAKLEERYYRLLKDLRGREKAVRETLAEAERPCGCAGSVQGASPVEARLRLITAADELKHTLECADRQFSQIYRELGEEYAQAASPRAKRVIVTGTGG